MAIKSELIVGAFKEAFPLHTGTYGHHDIDFKRIYQRLCVAPRFTLENNPQVRHLISYCPLLRINRLTGYLEVLLYQRPDKKSGNEGEERLAGDFSIGFGGHFEFAELPNLDKVQDPEVAALLIAQAFTTSTGRELDEEIQPEDDPSFTSDLVVGNPTIETMIIDNSNDVGLQHVGLATYFRVIDGVTFKARGEEVNNIKVIGWFTPQQIRFDYHDLLENWSKMLNDLLILNTEAIKERFEIEDATEIPEGQDDNEPAVQG